jgi:hypothetical protein
VKRSTKQSLGTGHLFGAAFIAIGTYALAKIFIAHGHENARGQYGGQP